MPVPGPRWSIIVISLVLALAVGARLTGLWPCPVACRGGGAYEYLGPVPVTVLALAMTVIIAIAAVSRRSPPWLLPWATGVAAGCSVFYLWIAWSLGLVCPFCLTVHACTLTMAILTASWATLVAGLLGALALNAVFHHQVVGDLAPEPLPVPSATAAAIASPDDGRSWGPVDASLRADLVLDLTCSHCAGILPDLVPALNGVRVHERLAIRRGDPLSVDLARWGLAAGRRGGDAWLTYRTVLLGTKPRQTRDGLLNLHPDLLRPLEAMPVGDDRLNQERADLQRLGFRGQTPLLVLRDAAGRELARFEGDFTVAQVAAAVHAQLRSGNPAPP